MTTEVLYSLEKYSSLKREFQFNQRLFTCLPIYIIKMYCHIPAFSVVIHLLYYNNVYSVKYIFVNQLQYILIKLLNLKPSTLRRCRCGTGKYYSITYMLATPSLISCHNVNLNTVHKKKALNIVKIIKSKQRIGQIVLNTYYYGQIR